MLLTHVHFVSGYKLVTRQVSFDPNPLLYELHNLVQIIGPHGTAAALYVTA